LSDGDIMKGREILKTVTITEALHWLQTSREVNARR